MLLTVYLYYFALVISGINKLVADTVLNCFEITNMFIYCFACFPRILSTPYSDYYETSLDYKTSLDYIDTI